MRLIKFAAMAGLAATLIGCGHGYEGTYEAKATSSNKMVQSMAAQMGAVTIEIGSDYMVSEGQRVELDEIFVRESGGAEYLVMVKDGQEKTLKIIDDETLKQGGGAFGMTMVKVD